MYFGVCSNFELFSEFYTSNVQYRCVKSIVTTIQLESATDYLYRSSDTQISRCHHIYLMCARTLSSLAMMNFNVLFTFANGFMLRFSYFESNRVELSWVEMKSWHLYSSNAFCLIFQSIHLSIRILILRHSLSFVVIGNLFFKFIIFYLFIFRFIRLIAIYVTRSVSLSSYPNLPSNKQKLHISTHTKFLHLRN